MTMSRRSWDHSRGRPRRAIDYFVLAIVVLAMVIAGAIVIAGLLASAKRGETHVGQAALTLAALGKGTGGEGAGEGAAGGTFGVNALLLARAPDVLAEVAPLMRERVPAWRGRPTRWLQRFGLVERRTASERLLDRTRLSLEASGEGRWVLRIEGQGGTPAEARHLAHTYAAAISNRAEPWGLKVLPGETRTRAARSAPLAPLAPPADARAPEPANVAASTRPMDRAPMVGMAAVALSFALGLGWMGRRRLGEARIDARTIARLTGLRAASVTPPSARRTGVAAADRAGPLAFLLEYLLCANEEGRTRGTLAVIGLEDEVLEGLAMCAARAPTRAFSRPTPVSGPVSDHPLATRSRGGAVVVDTRIARSSPRGAALRSTIPTLADLLASPAPVRDVEGYRPAPYPAPAQVPAGRSALPMTCLLGTRRWDALCRALGTRYETVVLIAPRIGAAGFDMALAGCDAVLVVCDSATARDHLLDRMACLRAHALAPRMAVALVEPQSKTSVRASR